MAAATTPRGLEPASFVERLKGRAKQLIELGSETADAFSKNEGYRLGAAFSYYATFSIFPLALLGIAGAGFVLGDNAAARDRVLGAIGNQAVRDVMERTIVAMQESHSGRGLSAIVGVVTLLFAASGAFVELDAALNRIWHVPIRESKGILGSIRLYLTERLTGLAIMAGLGLTLLLSLVSSSLLSFIVDKAKSQIEIPIWPALAHTGEVTATLVLLSAFFTAAFHFIPRSRPPAKVVAGGAVLTTVVLLALKEVYAAFLSGLTSYSAYGVAGGVLALASWIYISSMIIFFGAQLTRINAEKCGDCEKVKL